MVYHLDKFSNPTLAQASDSDSIQSAVYRALPALALSKCDFF